MIRLSSGGESAEIVMAVMRGSDKLAALLLAACPYDTPYSRGERDGPVTLGSAENEALTGRRAFA